MNKKPMLKRYTNQQLIDEIKERITNDPVEMPKLIQLGLEKMKINDPNLYQKIIEVIMLFHGKKKELKDHTNNELFAEINKRLYDARAIKHWENPLIEKEKRNLFLENDFDTLLIIDLIKENTFWQKVFSQINRINETCGKGWMLAYLMIIRENLNFYWEKYEQIRKNPANS